MILHGVVDQALGAFLCFRGFAKFGDLADASSPNASFQRDSKKDHVKEIAKFLNGTDGLFFPEVVLGTTWERLEIAKGKEINQLLRQTDQKQVRRYTGKNSAIVISKPAPKGSTIRRFALSLNQTLVSRTPFSIIDGNHRLLAAKEYEKSSVVHQCGVSFCVVIFQDAEALEKNSALMFHNINYRAVPIEEEKNLELILDTHNNRNEYLFPGPFLQESESFGLPYYYARVLTESYDKEFYPALDSAISKKRRTFFLRLLEWIGANRTIDEKLCRLILRRLERVDEAIFQIPEQNRSVELCLAMTYVIVTQSKADEFVSWVLSNELAKECEVAAESLVSMFEAVHKKGPYKVFVAMPYVSHAHVNEYNKLFKEVFSDLKDEKNRSYELIPIMRFRGSSQRIDRRLIDQINACDIFIADITGANDNVIFEVGFAEGAGKPIFLIRADNDEEKGNKVPFDMDKLQYIPYSSTGYYNSIKTILRNHLPIIASEISSAR